MRGILPERIVNRAGKGDYTPSMDEALRAICQTQPPAPLDNRSGRMRHYVNWPRATALVERFLYRAPELRWQVWSLVTLDRWLEVFWKTPHNMREEVNAHAQRTTA